LQKVKNSSSQVVDIVKAMIKNVMAINTYKSIEENYAELTIPHYSKTSTNLSNLTGYYRFDYTPLSSFQEGIVYSKPLSD
jgi:hypothetical protein